MVYHHEDQPAPTHTSTSVEQEVKPILEHSLLFPPAEGPDGTGTELPMGKAEADFPDCSIVDNQILETVNEDAEHPPPSHAVLQEGPIAQDISRTSA